jgi:hypothetical protein
MQLINSVFITFFILHGLDVFFNNNCKYNNNDSDNDDSGDLPTLRPAHPLCGCFPMTAAYPVNRDSDNYGVNCN